SVGGLRSQATQDQLYAQGRTAPGSIVTYAPYSNHQSGRALDVVPTGGTTEDQVGKTLTDPTQNDPRFAGMPSGATFSRLYDPLHVELNQPQNTALAFNANGTASDAIPPGARPAGPAQTQIAQAQPAQDVRQRIITAIKNPDLTDAQRQMLFQAL